MRTGERSDDLSIASSGGKATSHPTSTLSLALRWICGLKGRGDNEPNAAVFCSRSVRQTVAN